MADSYLTSLVTPTLALYGADPAVPAAPAASAPPPVKGGIGMALAGLVFATGVSAGVGAIVGRAMYPEVGAARFAKVGAVSYAVPAGLLLAVSSFYFAQKKKERGTEFRQGSAS